MKILHVITSLRTGGAEHLLTDLLPQLRSLGNEVELLIFDGRKTPFYEEMQKTGIKIHALGNNMYDSGASLKMVKYVKETEKYVLPLLDVVKEVPSWNNAAWLMRYQMITMLEAFKRLL